MKSIPCPYCGGQAVFCPSSAHLYHGRDFGPVYDCRPCDAYVGCHRIGDGTQPKGTPADARTREARKRAHAAFDPLWQGGGMTRKTAYRWLQNTLGMSEGECHIGKFDIGTCAMVIAAATRRKAVAHG